MNQKGSRRICFELIPEKRKDKLAVLEKAITEGAYKVKAEDIADKILSQQLYELALALHDHKYQEYRNRSTIGWPENTANTLS
jgi:hypothetical protein